MLTLGSGWRKGTPIAGNAPPEYGQPGYYSYFNNGGSIYDPKKIEASAPLRPPQPLASKKPSYHSKIPSYRKLPPANGSQREFYYRLHAAYLQSGESATAFRSLPFAAFPQC